MSEDSQSCTRSIFFQAHVSKRTLSSSDAVGGLHAGPSDCRLWQCAGGGVVKVYQMSSALWPWCAARGGGLHDISDLSAYDVQTGSGRWQRRSLKKIEDNMDQPAWLAAAWAEFGVREVTGAADDARVLRLFSRRRARRHHGTTRRRGARRLSAPYCDAPGLKHTGSLMARSYHALGRAAR